MKKIYVLDTNVILQNPNAIFTFEDNDVRITEITIKELDKFKKESSERGLNSREFARILDKLRKNGNLYEGVKLPDSGNFKIESNFTKVKLPESWDITDDARILRVCKGLIENNENPILVTKDIFMRILADRIGVTSQDYFNEQVSSISDQYKGRIDVYANDDGICNFCSKDVLYPSNTFLYENDKMLELTDQNYTLNQFVKIMSFTDPNQIYLGYFNGDFIQPLQFSDFKPYGISSRNDGQKFFQEALMRSAIEAPLIVCKGPAGTAKTFYSLAVGLENVLSDKKKSYRNILVCRPNIKLDEEIGFLPGSEQEKLAPFLRPVIDNLEILLDSNESERYNSEKALKDKCDEIFDRRIITTEAIAFIRGRSISKTWIIIDEAQNLTPKQAKAIVTRAGKDSKIILIGDPQQIDHPLLDERTNGLSYVSEKMKGSPYCWQITLSDEECERSALSQDASIRL
ncbi:MAG: PhoH family protein [Clostridia bacterium]|nr:PhoH family protein [Clostridia bacterium]